MIFAGIWIVNAAIPVKPIFFDENAFNWAIHITFDWMTLDSFDDSDN